VGRSSLQRRLPLLRHRTGRIAHFSLHNNYELRAEIALLNAEVAELTEGRSTDSPSGKNPPSAPKFSSVKGPGKLTVEAWLLQYVDWCELHNVPAVKRVSYAIQALEGDAIQNWYNLKRGLLAEDKDPHSWGTFRSGMIAGYAEVSPDIYVRTHLSKLRQGSRNLTACDSTAVNLS